MSYRRSKLTNLKSELAALGYPREWLTDLFGILILALVIFLCLLP